MTQVVLIRPGATVYDEQNRVQGILDVPLSDRGRAEVAQLAETLAGPEPSTVDAGRPLLRSRRKRRSHRRGRRQGPWAPAQADRRPPQPRPGALAGTAARRDQATATSRSSASGSTTRSPFAPPGRDDRRAPCERIKAALRAPDQAASRRGHRAGRRRADRPVHRLSTCAATPASSSTTTSPPAASNASKSPLTWAATGHGIMDGE